MDRSRRSGERAPSIDALFEGHYARLVRSLTLVAGDRETAADAVQEAFVKAHLRWRLIATYEDPVGWIRRVAINELHSRHRRRRRGGRALDRLGAERFGATHADGDLADQRSPSPTDVVHLDVVAALRELSDRQRTAAVLYYLEGLSVDDTASVMGVTPGSVKTHLSRAREALRPLLEVR